MPFTTASEWVALALALLGGLLLGLALHPGARKWRQRYVTERDAHAVYRRDSETRLTGSDARVRELETAHARNADAEARLAEYERDRGGRDAELTRDRDLHAGEMAKDRESLSLAQARIRELERENGRLAQSQPAPVSTVQPVRSEPVASAAPQPIAQPVSPPATPLTRRVVGGDRTKRSWFDWGPGSDPRATRVR